MKRFWMLLALTALVSGCGEEKPTAGGNSTVIEGTWATDCLSASSQNFRSVAIFTGSAFRTYNEVHTTAACNDPSPAKELDTTGLFQIQKKDERDGAAGGSRYLNYLLKDGSMQYDIFVLAADGTLKFGATTGDNTSSDKRPLALADVVFKKVQ